MREYIVTCCSTADMSRTFMETNEVPFAMFHYQLDGKEYADILEAELKSQRYPLLETVVTIGISADNLEEMEKKAVTVRGIYEDFAFGIERPLADQLKLFMQCIPGMGVLTGVAPLVGAWIEIFITNSFIYVFSVALLAESVD